MLWKLYKYVEIISGTVLEIEKIQNNRAHSKKTKRSKRTSHTPEAMAKNKERQAVKKLARLINCNFIAGDMIVTLTYKQDDRPDTPEKTKKDIANFLRRLKEACKKIGIELIYIGVSNFGCKGVPHHHMLLKANLITAVDIEALWGLGIVRFTKLTNRDNGDYTKIAYYFLRHTNKVYNDPKRRVHAKRYISSRNLKQPIIITKIIKSDSWRAAPSAPNGYWLISDSVINSVNSITGWPYQYYKCIRLT